MCPFPTTSAIDRQGAQKCRPRLPRRRVPCQAVSLCRYRYRRGPHRHRCGAGGGLGDCEIKLITGSVYLDAHEREETARACVEQVVCMTQALTDVDSPNGRSWGSDTDFTIDNIPFNHPTRMLVVAVAQDKRLDTSAGTDNYLNRGGASAAPTSVWSDDGKDCATLPKNDFEYRLQSGTGANTVLQHSLSKIALKLNNHDRLSGDLHAGFYNTTQAMVGYVPRSGIYVIPFSLNVRAEAVWRLARSTCRASTDVDDARA